MRGKDRISSNDLLEKIEEYMEVNQLKPHEKLPSERELCGLWACNRITLRAAIKKLVYEDILYSVHGSGTYVAEKKIDRNLWQLRSLSEEMKESGVTITTKLISINKVEANKHLASTLNISVGTEIIEIKRLRNVDDKPMALEVSCLGNELCKGIENFDLEARSLFQILKSEFSINLAKATEEIGIAFATEEESNLLQIQPKEPVLIIKGITYNRNDEPVEYLKSITRRDRCIFSSILRKSNKYKDSLL